MPIAMRWLNERAKPRSAFGRSPGYFKNTVAPRSAGLDSLRRLKITIDKLDASVGAPGPHILAVRANRRCLTPPARPSHPASNVRDDRDTPLLWSGMGELMHDF
jgi:hypothetical protein